MTYEKPQQNNPTYDIVEHMKRALFNKIVKKKSFDYIPPGRELLQGKNKKYLASRIKKWLIPLCAFKDINWSYFVTLTFRNEMRSYMDTRKIVSKFLKNLNNEIFGKRSKKSIRCLVFIEDSKYHGYHVHLMIEDVFDRLITDNQFKRCGDEMKLKKLVQRTWNQTDRRTGLPSLETHSQSFKRIYDDAGLIDYLMKQFKRGSEVFAFDLMNIDGRYNEFM